MLRLKAESERLKAWDGERRMARLQGWAGEGAEDRKSGAMKMGRKGKGVDENNSKKLLNNLIRISRSSIVQV